MFVVREDIDEIVKETSTLMIKMRLMLQDQKISLKENVQKGAAVIGFRLGFEYFTVSKDALGNNLLIGGGVTVRTGLENLVDLLYIYGEPQKYAEAYVDSMRKFHEVMTSAAANKDIDSLAKSRELKQANKWTNSTIDDRLKASGNSFIAVYDMLSYFGHPNPGSLNYVIKPRLKAAQINLLKQANCMIALTLMSVTLHNTAVDGMNLQEIDDVATRIGLKLNPDS